MTFKSCKQPCPEWLRWAADRHGRHILSLGTTEVATETTTAAISPRRSLPSLGTTAVATETPEGPPLKLNSKQDAARSPGYLKRLRLASRTKTALDKANGLL